MNIEKRNKEQLDRFLSVCQRPEFGASYVQRLCQCGYNEACHILEYGERKDYFVMDRQKPYIFKLK